MPQRILALDISAAEIKAAVLETTFRDYRVAGLYREAITTGDAPPTEQLRRFVAEHGNGADTVLSALPGDKVTWRTFYLPFRDKKKLTQTIPFELESVVPFGLDEVVIDFQVLSRDRAGTTVLAALVPKRDLERHLEVLREAGADPKIVDVGPLSTLNALSLVPDLPATFAFLDCSLHPATVALYREGQLVGLRTLSWASAPAAGGNGAGHEAAQAPGWLAELRWTLLALNGAPLDDDMPCLVAGDASVIEAMQPQLKADLGLRVRRLEGLKVSTAEAKTSGLLPAFASSIGLALREVAPANALGINFRRGEFTFHRDQLELSRALRSVVALFAVVVMLWVGQLYGQYWQLVERTRVIEEQIQRVVGDALGGGVRRSNAPQQLQAEVEALRARVGVLNDVVPVSTSTSVDVLRAISGAIPNRIRVDSEEYSMDADAVRLRANTDTFESVDAIKQVLLDTGFFSDVQVKDAKAGKDGNGVDFRLVLDLNKNPVLRAEEASAGAAPPPPARSDAPPAEAPKPQAPEAGAAPGAVPQADAAAGGGVPAAPENPAPAAKPQGAGAAAKAAGAAVAPQAVEGEAGGGAALPRGKAAAARIAPEGPRGKPELPPSARQAVPPARPPRGQRPDRGARARGGRGRGVQ